jgi:Putative DNA-binding domain
MTSWSQSDFAARLIDGGLPLPQGVTSWTSEAPARRFNVYRNNMRGALAEALAVRYPAVLRLVGEDFFQVMARDYAVGNLPRSPVLISYGRDFPAFIAGFAPAATLPYLADVARLESAHWEAYHAADVEPLGADVFAALDPSTLADLRVTMLPSVTVISSCHPIISIWRTNVADEDVAAIDLSQAEDALIVRPALDVEVRKLPPGGATFLSLLQQGISLGQAAGVAADSGPDFDLASNLAGLMQSKIVASIAS